MSDRMNGRAMAHEMGAAGFKPAFTNGSTTVATPPVGGAAANDNPNIHGILHGGATGGGHKTPVKNMSAATSTELHAHFGMDVRDVPHPHKEPLSPAISSISTHCGGSPNQMSATTTMRSLSNMSHLELCNMSTATAAEGFPHPKSSATNGGRPISGRISQMQMLEEETFTPKNVVNKPLSPEKARSVTPIRKPKVKSEAPIHKAKLKGEAQPVPQSGFGHQHSAQHGEKAVKILDEAHHFGLCEHYAKLLDQAKQVGFENVKWPTGFTLFHLAAKKNNKEFIEWLVRNDMDDVHAIDDFGKKPIDYSCPKKRDSVHDTLFAMMLAIQAPDTAAQRKYEAIKNGTYVDPTKIPKEKKKGMGSMAAILQSADIAEGDVPLAKPGDMMTAYEAETVVPVEYKKCFKQMANGGWSAMEAKWPNGGQTVLHWAARNGKEELCHFLVLEYGADPHQEDGNGHDAMYHAKLKRHRKLAKKLLLKFKDPKNTKGKKK